MSTARFVALTRPVAGREAEYNDWYDREHLPSFLALAGFRSAQRYRLAGQGPGLAPPAEYLAIYEIDGPVQAAQAAVAEAARTGRLAMSDLIDPEHVATWWYEPVGERQDAPD